MDRPVTSRRPISATRHPLPHGDRRLPRSGVRPEHTTQAIGVAARRAASGFADLACTGADIAARLLQAFQNRIEHARFAPFVQFATAGRHGGVLHGQLGPALASEQHPQDSIGQRALLDLRAAASFRTDRSVANQITQGVPFNVAQFIKHNTSTQNKRRRRRGRVRVSRSGTNRCSLVRTYRQNSAKAASIPDAGNTSNKHARTSGSLLKNAAGGSNHTAKGAFDQQKNAHLAGGRSSWVAIGIGNRKSVRRKGIRAFWPVRIVYCSRLGPRCLAPHAPACQACSRNHDKNRESTRFGITPIAVHAVGRGCLTPNRPKARPACPG